MINSDDPEIAALGAMLALQENEQEALKLKGKKWGFCFYKSSKGELYLQYFYPNKHNLIKTIFCRDLQEINKDLKMGFGPKSYIWKLDFILEYDSESNTIKEKEL